MRKIVVSIAVLLLVISTLFTIGNFGLEDQAVPAKQGVMDLTHIPQDLLGPVSLRGEWIFHPNEVVSPEAIPASSVMIEVPSSWCDTELTGTRIPAMGFGTYQLAVRLPAPGNYSLLLDNIYTSYKIFINGRQYAEVGRFGTSAAAASPRFTDTIICFHSADGLAEIVLQVSNFTHPKAGIGVAPVLGPPEKILRLLIVDHGTSMLLVTIFGMAAFLSLVYYHKTNPDRSLLYFAGFCLMLALKTAVSNTVLSFAFPFLSSAVISKMEYLTIAGAVALFIQYSRHDFEDYLPRTLEYIVLTASVVYSLVVLFTPVRVYNPLLNWYTVVFLSSMCYWLVMMVRTYRKKRKVSSTLMLGSIVLVVAVLMQNGYYYLGISNLFVNKMAAIGMAFFILTHFYDMSMRFLDALALSHKTSKELEEQVAFRTKELHMANRQLERMATHDDLTNLYNRNELHRRIEEITDRSKLQSPNANNAFTVVYFDLDNFKFFNDHYSHDAGDTVLVLFSQLLQTAVRRADTVFRFGGDEFILFLAGTGYEGARAFAERFFQAMLSFNTTIEQALSLKYGTSIVIPAKHQLTCSLGMAVHDRGQVDLDTLIRIADQALLQAKLNGKNTYHIRLCGDNELHESI